LCIRSPLAALLHADLTGKYGERDVVAGAVRARKMYNVDTISTACLRIQFVHRLSVDTHHSPYICKENTGFSIKASWRMPAAGKVQ